MTTQSESQAIALRKQLDSMLPKQNDGWLVDGEYVYRYQAIEGICNIFATTLSSIQWPEKKTSDELLTLTASNGKLTEIGYNRGVDDCQAALQAFIAKLECDI